MSREIIFNEDVKEKIINGIDLLYNSVRCTLGPRGKNVIIDNNNKPFITNDGVTIAKNVESKDKFENSIINLIKQSAERTEQEAGDGTTTAIILAAAIIKEWFNSDSSDNNNRIKIKYELEEISDFLVERLKEISTKISTLEQIKQIATISANNDEMIGELISEAIKQVGFDGIINVEESSTYKSYIKKVKGMEVEKSILSPYFINNQTQATAELDEPYILIINDKVFNIKDILYPLKFATSNNKSIFIIANELEGEALSGLVVNSMQGNIRLAAIKSPGFGESRHDKLKDIAIFTGGKVLTLDMLKNNTFKEEFFGLCKKITCGDTTVIQDGDYIEEDFNNHIDLIKNKLKEDISNFDKEILNYRLAKLTSSIAVLKVGASTEMDLKEKKMRIEDALKAVKAAISDGYVSGGGLTFLNLNEILIESDYFKKYPVTTKLLKKAFLYPIRQILDNYGFNDEEINFTLKKIFSKKEINNSYEIGFDAKRSDFTNLKESGIIDPTKVIINAIKNSISVAGLMLTTEVIISAKEKIDYYG